jgi:hypothetical protein
MKMGAIRRNCVSLLFTLALTGCGTGIVTSGRVFFASDQHRAAADAALNALGALVDRPIVITDVTTSDYSGHACISCDPCQIELRSDLPEDMIESVVWHEFGHCRGLQHTKNGVMSPFPSSFEYYSSGERSQFLSALAASH